MHRENLRGWLQIATLGLFCVLAPAALFVGYRLVPPYPQSAKPVDSDLVSVLLTGVTVSLAILALVLAGVAIWGYGALRDEARKSAQKAAKVIVTKYLKSEEVRMSISSQVEQLTLEEFAKLKVAAASTAEYTSSQPVASKVEDSEHVNKPYPESSPGDGPKLAD